MSTINYYRNLVDSVLETCNRVNEIISCMEPIHQKAPALVVGAEIFKKEMTIEEDGDMATIRVGIARETEYVN